MISMLGFRYADSLTSTKKVWNGKCTIATLIYRLTPARQQDKLLTSEIINKRCSTCHAPWTLQGFD